MTIEPLPRVGRPRVADRISWSVAASIILATFILYLVASVPFDSDLRAQDIEAYWSAADRLRHGGALYAGLIDQPYTYAPWFAYCWVPLTYLPRELVDWVWLLVLLAAVAWLSYPLLGSPTGMLLGMLIVPQIIEYAWIGNVDAVMLAGLALLRTRAGPLMVGLAASLKITPIAFVAYYLVRHEWRRAATAIVVAAVLWLPVLAFDLSDYGKADTLSMTTPYSLWQFGPTVWLIGNGLVVGWIGIIALRQRRFLILAAAAAAMLGNPRLNLYNVGYLAVPARNAVTKQR